MLEMRIVSQSVVRQLFEMVVENDI